MSTFNTCHKLQLRQLRTIDPAAHQQAITMLGSGFSADTVQIIVTAMQAALTRLTTQADPVTAIHTALTGHIEAGKAIPVKGMTKIYADRDIQAYLRRDDSDRLRLVVYHNGIPRSTQVGYYGRDFDHISSARAGCWKVAKEAKESIARLLQESTR